MSLNKSKCNGQMQILYPNKALQIVMKCFDANVLSCLRDDQTVAGSVPCVHHTFRFGIFSLKPGKTWGQRTEAFKPQPGR